MEKNDGRKMICRRGYNFNRRNEKNKKETGSHTERICGFAGLLQKDSGTRHRLRNFGIYMNQLFTIDALFLNEDRHTHNMAVLMDGEGRFSLCSVFDNGGALLSDMSMDYPMSEDPVVLMREVKAKTISTDFDEQLDVSERLTVEISDSILQKNRERNC